MQCGFAFLEAGAVRSKNTTNILIKNLLDSCKSRLQKLKFFAEIRRSNVSGIAIVGYWALGWALAFGDCPNNTIGLFVGYSEFFLANFSNYPK